MKKIHTGCGKWIAAMMAALALCTSLLLASCGKEFYRIAFVANGEDLFVQEVESGATFSVPDLSPSKAEDENYTYTFDGWLFGEEGERILYDGDQLPDGLYIAGMTVTAEGSITFCPVFRASPKATYTVTFTDSITSDTVGEALHIKAGGEVELPAAPVHEGYTFTGWKVGGESELKQAGEKVTIVRRTEIAAQYSRKTYTLTLHYLENTAIKEVPFGSDISEVAAEEKIEGLIFGGWYIAKTGGSAEPAPETMPAENLELAVSYTIDLTAAELSLAGDGIYGGGDDLVTAVDLPAGENFTYAYEWEGVTADGANALVKAAGETQLSCTVKANYKNLVKGEKKLGLTATLQKAELTAAVSLEKSSIVYGETPVPSATLSGYCYEDEGTVSAQLVYSYLAGGEAASGRLSVGEYSVTAFLQAALGNYTLTAVPATLTVTKKEVTATVSLKNTIVYGEQPAPAITFGGLLDGDDESVFTHTGAQFIYHTEDGQPHDGTFTAGRYTVQAADHTAKNYTVIKGAAASFEVTKKPVTVTLTANETYTYGDEVNISVAWDGFIEGESAETVFGEVPAVTYKRGGESYTKANAYFDAGEYTATMAAEGEHGNYTVTVTDAHFTVNKKIFTLSDHAKQSRNEPYAFEPRFGEPSPFVFEGKVLLKDTHEGLHAATDEDTFNASFKWENGYHIKLGGADVTENFTLAYDLNVTLDKSNFSVKEPATTSYVYDGTEHDFSVTVKPVDGETVTYEVAYKIDGDGEYSATAPKFTAAGSHTVAYRVTAADYEDRTGSYTVSITKKTDNAISVGAHEGFTYDGSAHQMTITASADFGEVTAVCTGGIVVTKLGNEFTLTLTNAGTYTVTFTVEDTENYNGDQKTAEIAVGKGTAPAVAAPTVGEQINRYGLILQEIALGDHWRWVAPGAELIAGEQSYQAAYNPDPANYEDHIESITIKTNKTKLLLTFSEKVKAEGLEVEYSEWEAKTPEQFAGSYSLVAKNRSDLDMKAQDGEFDYLQKLWEGGPFSLETPFADGMIYGGTYLLLYRFSLDNDPYYEWAEGQDPTELDSELLLKIKSVEWNGALYTMEEALAAADSGEIIVKYNTTFATKAAAEVAGYTTEGGHYTVKDGVTLLLPYNESGSTHGLIDNKDARRDLSSFGDAAYKKLELTVPANITITNSGTIVIGGITSGGNGGNMKVSGQTCSDYAQIVMRENAKIESYGDITAYGFIVEATANNSSEVVMNKGALTIPFAVIEHRGGTIFKGMYSQGLLGSPFNRFYLENVTSKITVKDTASLLGWANLYASVGGDHETDVKLIGNSDQFMVQLVSGSYAVSKADTAKVMTLNIYGSFSMNVLSLSIAGVDIKTDKTMFPISWYLNITLNTLPEVGTATVDITKQDVKLLPGANVTIGEGVSVTAKQVFIADSSYQDVGLSATKYESSKGQANLIVNGTLTVDTIGGLVQTSGSTGKLVVNSSSIATTYEVLSNDGSTFGAEASWQAFTQSLKGKIYNDNGNSNAELLSVGTYAAKSGAWLTNTSKFDVQYKFFLRDGGGALSPLQNDGIDENNPNFYTHSGFKLNDASLEGYMFKGWYSNAECNQSIDQLDGTAYGNGSATLYGVFETLPEETQTYELILSASEEGATVYGDQKATVFVEQNELGDFVLPNAEREGYTFEGWYTQPDGAGEQITTLTEDKFAEGTLTLYAKWQIRTYSLTITVGANTSLTVTVGGTQYNTSTSSPISVAYGTTVTVTAATPASGYNNKFMVSSDPAGLIMKVGDSFVMNCDVKISTSTEKQAKGSACFAPGTLVTLADGTQKKIEDLEMGKDEILAFDHFTGKLVSTSAYLVIYRSERAVPTVKLHFSNGSMVHVYVAHGFFDVDTNQYEIISVENVAQYVGHKFYSIAYDNGNFNNEIVELVSYELSTEYSECYSLFTSLYVNHVINGMLAVTDDGEGLYNFFELDENMKYDEAKMQADIETYGLFTYEEFADYITKEEYDMFNVKYLKVAVGKGLVSMEQVYHYFSVLAEYRG